MCVSHRRSFQSYNTIESASSPETRTYCAFRPSQIRMIAISDFMKHFVSLLILGSISLGTIAPVRAQQQQQPAPDDVVRITTNLVQIDAVVTDKSGNPIKDLSASDFEVFQDGKPQKIISVSYINTEVPERTAEAQRFREKGQPPAPTSRTN